MNNQASPDVIIADVNSWLAERARPWETPMASDKAHNKFLELVVYANKVPAVAERLQQIANLGAGIMLCDLDKAATAAAGKAVFHYHLHERADQLLLACRAGDFVNWSVDKVGSHCGS